MQMQRPFRTFIGVDLGGGKGKTTAVVRLRLSGSGDKPLMVTDTGGGKPFFDDRLLTSIEEHCADAVVAIDAPLTLPVCVRCTLPTCPQLATCTVDTIRWFRERTVETTGKPRYTPYTQRATEVILQDQGILPRETLGQGMGPLTARAAYLRQALRRSFQLNHNLLEVYPKATLALLFPDPAPPQPASAIRYRDAHGRPVSLTGKPIPLSLGSEVARTYKRSGHGPSVRERVLAALPELAFGPGQWREFVVKNDHIFDALICAYTAYLWARDGWQLPSDPVFQEDGFIWAPPRRSSSL